MKTENIFDGRMDKECIELCNFLNTLDGITTDSSCSGHLERPYNIFFYCTSLLTLAILTRASDKNYGTDMWEILTVNSDTNPYACFLLRSKGPFKNKKEMDDEIQFLISNIKYWSKDEFKDYFKRT